MSNLNTVVGGLKDVVTSSQLKAYVGEPTISDSTPVENDGKYLLTRLYAEDKLNWCRSLDQCLAVRAVCRNFGGNLKNDASAMNVDALVFPGIPGPEVLFDLVWGLMPEFVRNKVSQWARENKDGAIANELTEYVKRALGMLPLPIPFFFVNTVANLVIPPLVSFIINHLANHGITNSATDASAVHAYMTFTHTSKSLEVMKDMDRQILLAAGLNPANLPPHLKSAASSDPGLPEVAERQPAVQDCFAAMEHFYHNDIPNGCRPLQLMQIVAAQVRINPECDKDPDTFGSAVYKTLDAGTQQKLKGWAKENPPNRDNISKALYAPVLQVLGKGPYFIPGPLLNTFASLKAPEVIEWVVNGPIFG